MKRIIEKEIHGQLLLEIVQNANLTKEEKYELQTIGKRVGYRYTDYNEATLEKLRQSARELGHTEFKSLITGRTLSI